jgi:outer membrane immunogenic protein
MKRIAIIAMATAGFATPVLASDDRPSFVVPVFAPDDRPTGPSYVASALASDPSPRPFTKAPPVVAAAYSWTGCYIGGHVGGVVSEDNTTSLFGSSISYGSAGFVGGGQIGCDYQFAPGWVAGIEGRAAGTSLKSSHAATVTNLVTGTTIPAQFTLNNDFLASATARLGHTFADRWLVYVRGGAAWTHEKADDAFTTVGGIAVDPSAALSRTGWTVGAGVDWAFAPHWSAVLEYNYYDFGSKDARLTDTASNVFVTGLSLKDTIHAVTAGVNYHF